MRMEKLSNATTQCKTAVIAFNRPENQHSIVHQAGDLALLISAHIRKCEFLGLSTSPREVHTFCTYFKYHNVDMEHLPTQIGPNASYADPSAIANPVQ